MYLTVIFQSVCLQQADSPLEIECQRTTPICEIPVFQIMPNHVHLIVCIDSCIDAACHVYTGENAKMRGIAECCGLLSTAIGGLKSVLTRYANTNKTEFCWQTRFYVHIIRNQEEMNQIATYIENYPITWENDKFYS